MLRRALPTLLLLPACSDPSSGKPPGDSGDAGDTAADTADTGDTAADDTGEDTGDDTAAAHACGALAWLAEPAVFSYTRPSGEGAYSFDVATTVHTVAGGNGPTYTVSTDVYVHWDGANPDYYYLGEETKAVVATFSCDGGVVSLEGIYIDMYGYGTAGASSHAWGYDGTVVLDPPVPIWREGETTWTAGTTAVWDGYDPSYGVPVIASYPESWTFDVGAVETVETGSGPVETTPLTLTFSGGAALSAWVYVWSGITWFAEDGVAAMGSRESRFVRE